MIISALINNITLIIALSILYIFIGIIFDNMVVDSCLRLFREKGFQLENV